MGSSLLTRWQISVLPVWLLSAVGVGFALFGPAGERIQWLAVVLVFGVLLTFLAQLATRQPPGFVSRARYSVTGVVVLVAVGGLISLAAG